MGENNLTNKVEDAIKALNREFDGYFPKLPKLPSLTKDGKKQKKVKVYVPDTNLWINSPDLFYILTGNQPPEADDILGINKLIDGEGPKKKDPNHLIALQIVKQELNNVKDNPKKDPFVRKSARYALKLLAEAYVKGKGNPLDEGVDMPNGAKLFEFFHRENFVPENFYEPNNDDRIIYNIKVLQEVFKDYEFIFVSSDARARSDAINLGIKAMEFEHEMVTESQLYTGHCETKIDSDELKIWKNKGKLQLIDKIDWAYYSSDTVLELPNRPYVLNPDDNEILSKIDEKMSLLEKYLKNTTINDDLVFQDDFSKLLKDKEKNETLNKLVLDDEDKTRYKELKKEFNKKRKEVKKTVDDGSYFLMNPELLEPNQIVEFITNDGFEYKNEGKKEIEFITDFEPKKYTIFNDVDKLQTIKTKFYKAGEKAVLNRNLADKIIRDQVAKDIHTNYGIVSQDKKSIRAFRNYKKGMFQDPLVKESLTLQDIILLTDGYGIDNLKNLTKEMVDRIELNELDFSTIEESEEYQSQLKSIINLFENETILMDPIPAIEAAKLFDKKSELPVDSILRYDVLGHYKGKKPAKKTKQYRDRLRTNQVGEVKDIVRERPELIPFLPPHIYNLITDSGKAHSIVAMSDEAKENWELLKQKMAINYSNNNSFNKDIKFSKEQESALELLLDKDVECVTLNGLAGTGKTFIALLAAMYQINRGDYQRVLVYKSLRSAGESIGFLPGGEASKIQPIMEPIEDNLGYMLENNGTNIKPEIAIKKLKESKQLGYGIETYIQGRTLRNTFVIIDEAHRYTKAEVKMFLGRMGEGSKAVFIGDPDQRLKNISFINEHNNGLIHMIAKLQGKDNYGHVYINKQAIIRSNLSMLSQEL